jgi:hypothetical protein
MTEATNTDAASERKKPVRGVLFTVVSSVALVVIPAAAIAAIVITVLLQPGFYTGILKDGRFITAFVQGKTWQTEQRINDEIERDLQLSKFTEEFEAVKSRHEQSRAAYLRVSREDVLESLKKEQRDLKGMEWELVKEHFPSEKDFEKGRDDQLNLLSERIKEIEEYQENNRDAIKSYRSEMKKAREEYEDALSRLEDKKKEAERIRERHRDTLSEKIYADLEIIERPLTKVLNEKLIDTAVRAEIEKVLRFLTSYNTQVEQRNIFYARVMDADGLGARSLRVKLPEISVSLWVDDDSGGFHTKKHILNQILVEELERMDALHNRTMLMTIFRLSDSSLGEYFAGKYLSRLGLAFEGGVIRMSNLVLKDEKAELLADIMEALSWGRYAVYGAVGLLALFMLFLIFSTVERRRKVKMLKRLFIYPSILVLAACGAVIWASRNIFSYYPDFIQDLSVRSFAKHLSFTAAWHFIVPLCIVFGTALIAGLVIRKYLAATEPEQKRAS